MIQALCFIALLGFAIEIFSSMMVSQSRSARAVQEKLAALESQKLISSALFSPGVCGKVFGSPTPRVFNARQLPQTLSLDGGRPIWAHMYSGVPGQIMAQVGTAVGQKEDGLIVRSIELTVTSGGAGSYSGIWSISFDSQGLVRAVAPLKIATALSVDDSNLDQAVIQNCANPTLPRTLRTIVIWSSEASCGGDPRNQNCPRESKDVIARCPAGYSVAGCGHNLVWNPRPSYDGADPLTDIHSNAPDAVWQEGNGCNVYAGGNPSCGVCFHVQAVCVESQ